MFECPEALLSFLWKFISSCAVGISVYLNSPFSPIVNLDSFVCMVSHKRSTLHEYSVRIRRSDSSMKNSARAQGCSEPRDEDLGMNYSSDAHFAREGRSMRRHFTDGGKKNVAPRRSNFRKGTRKTNQVRLVTVRLEECCKVILGGLKLATCYEAVTLKVVCKSPLHSTEIVVFFQHY